MARTRDTSSPTVAERFVKSLVVSAKSVVLYPPASNVPVQTAEKTAELLEEALRNRSEIRLAVTTDGILFEGTPLFEEDEVYSAFASELHTRGLAEVRFHAGMSPRDLVAFLSLLNYPPREALAMGGFEARLWERGVTSITVKALAPDAAATAVELAETQSPGRERYAVESKDDVERLLELIAVEPDSHVRNEILSALSNVAGDHVEVLGGHVDDERWYVVRNVVSALGHADGPEALPYLRRTLDHPEARVRREAVRALAHSESPEASWLLVRMLDDDDAQNVQLAARYLGDRRSAEAVPGLVRVARAEGAGNRETGPRAEAIEALGRIGSPSALPALEELASRRAVLSGSKARGLRAAAQSAIVEIKGGRKQE